MTFGSAEVAGNTVINIGVVGCGHAAYQHAEAVALAKSDRNVRLVIASACDADTDRAKQYCTLTGTVATDIEEMLASQSISAIAICTPPGSHYELAIRALEAGKAVMVEKPPVLTESELDAIIDAGRRARRPVLVMLQHRARLPAFPSSIRWGPNAGGYLEVIRKRPREHYLTDPWRSDVQQASGGHIAHLGIHLIDLACQVLGDPDQIEGVVNCRDTIGIDTNSALSVRFESGALFTMVSNAESELFSERLFIFDDEKKLTIGNEYTEFVHNERTFYPREKNATLRARVYEELLSALISGNRPHTFSIARARGAVRIAEAVRAIALKGGNGK